MPDGTTTTVGAILSALTSGLIAWAIRTSSTIHQLRERIARLEGRADRDERG